MIDKLVRSASEALGSVGDGATVMVGGFGPVGQPRILLDALIDSNATGLTMIANNAGSGTTGLARLIALGRVRKMICSFPRSSGSVAFEEAYRNGSIELEVIPQGTLAERIRAASAGIGAFYTRTAYGTLLAKGKETREIDGDGYVLEHPLFADIALVEAWRSDRWGNLTYKGSGRNFNPIMAAAALRTVVQVQHLAELGEMDPETVVTPGVYVQSVVHAAYGDPYGT